MQRVGAHSLQPTQRRSASAGGRLDHVYRELWALPEPPNISPCSLTQPSGLQLEFEHRGPQRQVVRERPAFGARYRPGHPHATRIEITLSCLSHHRPDRLRSPSFPLCFQSRSREALLNLADDVRHLRDHLVWDVIQGVGLVSQSRAQIETGDGVEARPQSLERIGDGRCDRVA